MRCVGLCLAEAPSTSHLWKSHHTTPNHTPHPSNQNKKQKQADVSVRTLRAAYWDNDARPLLRASWFSKPATNLPGAGASGAFVPYSEQDAAAIEETYQAALDETVRSLAAGSFLPTASSTEGLSASTSASASASVSASSVSVGSSSKGVGAVLLRKEMPLSDGTNKVYRWRNVCGLHCSACMDTLCWSCWSSCAIVVGPPCLACLPAY